jgi:hypothetical protein
LTLYVQIEDIRGILQGEARITGYDGNGNYFQENTGTYGYVTIDGTPGTWSFIVSAAGYETSSWSEPTTDTCTRHAVLRISLS